MQIATNIGAFFKGFFECFRPGIGRTHPTAPVAYDRGRDLAFLISGGW